MTRGMAKPQALLFAGVMLLGALPVTAHSQSTIDVSGVWQVDGVIRELRTESGKAPPFKPAAAKIYATNVAKAKAGDLSFDPSAHCVSPGLPRMLTLPYPFQIIQSANTMLYLFQWNYWNRRVSLVDTPQDVPYPLSLGVSNGRLMGSQLVIRTKGLRADNTWLDSAGMPRSEKMVIEERLTLTDGGNTLIDRMVVTDPDTFTAPWTTVLRFKRLPAGTRIEEDICLDRVDAGLPAVDWARHE